MVGIAIGSGMIPIMGEQRKLDEPGRTRGSGTAEPLKPMGGSIRSSTEVLKGVHPFHLQRPLEKMGQGWVPGGSNTTEPEEMGQESKRDSRICSCLVISLRIVDPQRRSSGPNPDSNAYIKFMYVQKPP